jgi:hypothetical protein
MFLGFAPSLIYLDSVDGISLECECAAPFVTQGMGCVISCP